MTFNDERILKISEFDMYIDLLITNAYDKYIERSVKDIDEDILFENDLDNGYTLEDLKSGKIEHLHVGGFTEEEIEKFWNDDTILK